ncbi:hypothetical protein Aperf_G00000022556 [Anoplocephala perfoliata]
MATKDSCIYNAKLAEQAKRFDEMVTYMDSAFRLGIELSPNDRNLLTVAYKNAILPRRRALDEISMAVQNAERENAPNYKCFLEYRRVVEGEIRILVRKCLAFINSCLLKDSDQPETKAFYYFLTADCYRYLAEFETGYERTESAENALKAYKNAFEIASGNLNATDPLRLGIALNFGIFYFDIVHCVDRACKIVQAAYDDAVAELDNLSEEPHKKTAVVMSSLKENMRLWMSPMSSADLNCCERPVC